MVTHRSYGKSHGDVKGKVRETRRAWIQQVLDGDGQDGDGVNDYVRRASVISAATSSSFVSGGYTATI